MCLLMQPAQAVGVGLSLRRGPLCLWFKTQRPGRTEPHALGISLAVLALLSLAVHAPDHAVWADRLADSAFRAHRPA